MIKISNSYRSSSCARFCKVCVKCEQNVHFYDKFCRYCGEPQKNPLNDVDYDVYILDKIQEAAKSHFSDFRETYGVVLEDARCGEFDFEKPLTFISPRHSARCAKCGKKLESESNFCTECGNKVNTHQDFVFELSAKEVKAIAFKALYEKYPELRPEEEYKYTAEVFVYHKHADSADFDEEPSVYLKGSGLALERLKEGVGVLEEKRIYDEVVAELAEDGVGKFFKDCIENRWLYGDFRDAIIEEAKCSLGDTHEFEIVVEITQEN